VLTVTQGEEALALIQEEAACRPRPDGRGDADARRWRPRQAPEGIVRIRVVYMSGYTNGTISGKLLLDGKTILLEKPFTADWRGPFASPSTGGRSTFGQGIEATPDLETRP
jgi:hypothetical protein